MKDIVLFENSLQTEIPDDFEDMPLGLIRIMFPNEERPQIIMGSPDGNAYVTFSVLEKTLTEQQLFMAAHAARALLYKFYPSCDKQRVHIIQLEDNMCGWFSFPARDMQNIMFIIAINNKMILGTCGCAEEDFGRLEDVKKSFLSIKVLPGKEVTR